VLTHDWLYGLLEIGLPGYSLEQRRVPSLSPALADLAGMPPALFTVGNLDPLRDDSLLLAGRWRLAGGRADLDVWPEGAHAFTNMATPLGKLALDRSIAWIDDLLGETGAADPATVVGRFISDVVTSGTQTGPFMGAPASGRRAEWLGIGIYRVVGGRITEAWFGEDILGMLLQLDAVTLGV
jgi:hypothetical protein